jgi:enoyl-CoA hydratase/carnithine racemase
VLGLLRLGAAVHLHPLGGIAVLVADFLHQLPQPAIAKIRGVAVGAGLNLALGCDLIAASSTARRSSAPTSRLSP